MPMLSTAQPAASGVPQPLTPTSTSSHLKCSGDCCGCTHFAQGAVSRTYCTCGHPIAWHGPSTRSGTGSLSVNVSAPQRSSSVPSSPSGSPTSSPTNSARSHPPAAAPGVKVILEQRRPSILPPPLPTAAPPVVPAHPVHPIAHASSGYSVAHAQATAGDGGGARPSWVRQGTLYSGYLLQHGLMPTAPPPTPPQNALPTPAKPSVPPPPLPAHLAVRSLSVTSAAPTPSSPAPVPSSPFDPSGYSPLAAFSPAVHSASFSCTSTSALQDTASPKKPLPPPVPLFSSAQSPSLNGAANDGLSVAPALPARSSPMRTNRPPPIVPPVYASAPVPSISPPSVPAATSVSSAPTHRSLPSDSFSTHLHHLPDVASAHSQSGLLLTKRCRSFFRHYAQLQQRHAADIERLVSHEMGKLSALGDDAMGGAGRVWQGVLMKVGMEGVLQAGYGGDVLMQCEEQLERFEQVGSLMSREHDAEVRRSAAVLDKVRVQVEKEREVTRQALASFAHRKEKENHDGVGLAAAMHAAALLNGGVDGARRKALRCCEAYQRELDAANVTYQQHTRRDLPALLTQMQSLEEMRLQSLHAAFSAFASLHASHAKAVRDVSADVKSLVATVSAEHDIKGFIARVIQQHGPPLPSQPFYYDCSITPAELRQEIDAEEKRSASTASAAVEARRPSLFHTSLEGVMEYEKAMFEEAGKESTASSYASYPPDIPRILPVLIAAIEGLGGLSSEGIFRLSVSSEELHAVRRTLERGDYHLSSIDNPNVPAAVLKAWLRDLSSPLIPFAAYDRCIELGKTPVSAVFDALPPNPALAGLVALIQSLPPLNRRVLFYLMAFLHRLSLPPHVELSRMTVFNLAIVFSPTLLRSESNDAVVLMRDSKWGCGFIALLIESVGRGVGWEEERAWRARWEGKAAPTPSPSPGGGRLPRPSVVPPPVPSEYLSPTSSPPPSPGLVGGRVQHLSFAEQHAVHTPRSSTAAPSLPIAVHTPTAIEPRQHSESSEMPALPEHWRAILDSTSGQIYYANALTSETQWARPC